MNNKIECMRFKSFERGLLIGYADLFVPAFGLEIFGCTVFNKNGHKWISFPSKESGVDDTGKKKYFPHFRFKTKEAMDSFSREAIEAIDAEMAKMASANNSIDEIWPEGEPVRY